MTTSHISTRGIHWIEQGHGGHAVVLLHGLGGDAKFWTAEQAELSKHFRTLAVDLKGSGLSLGSPDPITIETLAQDVIGVMDDAGIGSAHIVGFSMGGVVAQAVAIAAPERVDRLVLAATFAAVNAQARLFLQAVGAIYQAGATAAQMYDLIVPWLFSSAFLASERAMPYLAYAEDPTDRQTREDWLRLLDAMLEFDSTSRLGDIRAPTLIVCGDSDPLATTGDAEALRGGIRGARLAVVRGGHLFNVESPRDFMLNIAGFIAGD